MARETAELPPVSGLESITQYMVGRACYRAGKFAEAVEWLQKAFEKANGRVTSCVIAFDLALAYHYWGRATEARDWFERATNLLEQAPSFIPGHHRAEIEVLRHEGGGVMIDPSTGCAGPEGIYAGGDVVIKPASMAI